MYLFNRVIGKSTLGNWEWICLGDCLKYMARIMGSERSVGITESSQVRIAGE